MTYCVIRSGVYIQGVHGPCVSQTEAMRLAQTLASGDDDDYHTWDVCVLSPDGLGEPVASYRKWYRGDNIPAWKMSGRVEMEAMRESERVRSVAV